MRESDPNDLALGDDGDLLIAGGDLVLSSGLDGVTQGLRIVLGTYRGEVHTDLDAGVPWYQEVIGQPYSDGRVRALLTRHALTVPGVAAVTSIDLAFDRSARRLTGLIAVLTTWGAAISAQLVEEI